MQAVQFRRYGGPEVVEWGEAPEPHAGAGHVRIAVRAASVNPIDVKTLSGGRVEGDTPPGGIGHLGFDAAGVVDEVGSGVTDVAVGDEVFGQGQNTHAEYAVLGTWAVKPASVDWALAGAAAVVGETGERGLRLLGITAGTTVFVDGGTGGVGAVAVQLAVARGARVIASASEANHQRLRDLDAVPVRYGDGVADRVREAAGGPVDGVFDVAGRTPADQLVGLVAEPTQVVTIANFGAGDTGIRATGGGSDSRGSEALAEVAADLGSGALQIEVSTRPMAEAAEAYREILTGHVRGKLVLIP